MGDTSPDRTRFFGRVTSVVTHELMNVFAVIRETAGLVEDLLLMAGKGAKVPDGKLLEKLSTVKKQVDRGATITAALNCFSHGPDRSVSEFDAHKTTEQLVFLTGRLARSGNIAVTVEDPEGPCPVRTSSVAFQMILFLGLELLTEVSREGTALSVSVRAKGSGCAVSISPGKRDNAPQYRIEGAGQWREINDLCGEIGASASVDSSGTTLTFSF